MLTSSVPTILTSCLCDFLPSYSRACCISLTRFVTPSHVAIFAVWMPILFLLYLRAFLHLACSLNCLPSSLLSRVFAILLRWLHAIYHLRCSLPESLLCPHSCRWHASLLSSFLFVFLSFVIWFLVTKRRNHSAISSCFRSFYSYVAFPCFVY